MIANKELIDFIKEARKRGFSDYEIREPLLKNGWMIDEIEMAFASTRPSLKYKNKICFYIDSIVLKAVERRAKKNMMTTEEQIEDIIRRSAVSAKHIKRAEGKLDDLLISIFSRSRKGRRRK